jgi:phosphoribosylformylglycinamidine (FGAM) synthase PurS component
MIRAVLRRWLKVADPTALTARETLQRSLAYGRRVEEVARSELWVFAWEQEPRPGAVLERLAGETNLLQNPNKHRIEIVVGEERVRPRGNVWVLVSSPGAGRDLADTLRRHRLLPGEVPRTAWAQLWELTLEEGEEERARLAEEIAVVRGRKQGLLANPHVEDARVFVSPPTASDVAEALFLERR